MAKRETEEKVAGQVVFNITEDCEDLSHTSRGHTVKIYKPQVHLDVRKFFSQLGL